MGRKREQGAGGGLKTDPCRLWAHFGKHRTGPFVHLQRLLTRKTGCGSNQALPVKASPTDLRQAAVLCTSHFPLPSLLVPSDCDCRLPDSPLNR